MSTFSSRSTCSSASDRPRSPPPVVVNSVPSSNVPGDRVRRVVDDDRLDVALAGLVHELGVGDLVARCRWARGWAGSRARATTPSRTHIVHRGQLPGRRSPSPPGPDGPLLVRRALLTAPAARRRRWRRRGQVAHGSMLRRPRPGGSPVACVGDRSGRAVEAPGPPLGWRGLVLFAAVSSADGIGVSRRQCSRSGCAERAVVSLTYEYGRSHVWLDLLHPERDPHAYDLCRRHAAAPVRAPRLEVVRPPTDRANRCWTRRVCRPSERRRGERPALAWDDVRGVVSRVPLRDAGRRVDVPVAVATWVIAFVAGQARFGDRPRLLRCRRRRPRTDPHPVRSGGGDLDRLPRRDVGGVPALGVGRLRRGLPAPLRARSTSSACRSECSPSWSSSRCCTCRCRSCGRTRSRRIGSRRTPRSSSTAPTARRWCCSC